MKSRRLLHGITKKSWTTTGLFLILLFGLIPCSIAGSKLEKKEYFVIAIDTGHSEDSPGAIGARGTQEYILNKKVSALLNKKLIERGFKKTYILNYGVSNISLKHRVDTIRSSKYDVLVSIHHDSVQPVYLSSWTYQGKNRKYCDKFRGFSIFVSERNIHSRNSSILSAHIGDRLLESGFTPSLYHAELVKGEGRKLIDRERGIFEFSDLYVLSNSHGPAILIECGVIVNREEEKLLIDHSYQDKLASSIATGIDNYFKQVQ